MSLTKRQPLVTKENMVTKATEVDLKELNSGNGICILKEISHVVQGIYKLYTVINL